jgi:hypothetical protein
MNAAKIQFSQEEMDLLISPGWLLTKNRIIEKLYGFFGEQSKKLQALFAASANQLPEEILLLPPKIAKGEQYQGLPYIMLDYPRCFGKEDICAIRIFFWWGHFLSVTLHLKGAYSKRYRSAIMESLPKLAALGFRIAVGEEEWRHDLDTDYSIPLAACSEEMLARVIDEKAFCKLSAAVALEDWHNWDLSLAPLYQALYAILVAA